MTSGGGVNDDWQTRKSLAQTNLYMLQNKVACDVTFRVGPTREIIEAHKFMLISRSHVFAAIFTGPMAEMGQVDIPDVPVNIFNLFLGFVYTDDVTLSSDNVMHLLYLAKKYSTGKLEDVCLACGIGVACDVTFRVGPTREIIEAHKSMLISRSHVFAAMFTDPMAEMGQVDIPDVGVNIFNLFLRFLYTDYIKVNSDSVIHLLYLAKKYCTGKLEDMCLEFLKTSLNANNVCTILEQAKFFNEDELHDKSMSYILENGKLTLESHDFLTLLQKSVLDIVKSDTSKQTRKKYSRLPWNLEHHLETSSSKSASPFWTGSSLSSRFARAAC
ncbi:BTB/POZ domain-containing protein 6-B-like [Gigantopelta aegis]|uniref:BTB/POZ domain-containing protein 6-B-like n=1 Tax=Gigantopelta aegis TaxID=1735272 RepID=UPI001B88848E|nr:BTB/POZ domain-containing protein 6-B-like [Gigantopelta aegis]